MAKPVAHKWYNERAWAVSLGAVAFILAYVLASRALDTGSWQQYFLTLFLIIFGLNRLFRAVWPKRAAKV